MNRKSNLIISLLSSLCLIGLSGCSGDSGSSGSSESSTYTLSGSLSQNSSSSFAFSSDHLMKMMSSVSKNSSNNRSQCSDGKFYAVYCLSFTAPPVAAEGNVDCSNGGGFQVAGLPKGEAIGCFLRRYDSASSADGSNVGSIEIPATSLSGSTRNIVAEGDVELAVNLSDEGTISATVQSGNVNQSPVADSGNFTAANMNGIWGLSCESNAGGDQFAAGLCKCFLGENFYSGRYNNQDECMADPAGPGSQITENVSIGIEIAIHTAQAIQDIPLEHGASIPSGSTINAISIWGVTGNDLASYASRKGAGGEGVTDLGGQLNWTSTPSPATAVAWQSSIDLDGATGVTVPAVPSATANQGAWISWAQTLANNAEAQGFSCSWGPQDSEAVANSGALGNNIDCMNEVLEAMNDVRDAVVPKVWIRPFCNQNGCLTSVDAADGTNSRPYHDANSMNYATIEVEGMHFNYPPHSQTAADHSAVAPIPGDGLGPEPASRYAFEPLEVFPDGAGFRQSHEDQRHFHCQTSGGDVNNSACTSGASDFYELVCHTRSEMSIQFFGSSSPMDVLFDTIESVGYAALIHHSAGGPQEISPAGTTPLDLCLSKVGGGSGAFFARGTKKP